MGICYEKHHKIALGIIDNGFVAPFNKELISKKAGPELVGTLYKTTFDQLISARKNLRDSDPSCVRAGEVYDAATERLFFAKRDAMHRFDITFENAMTLLGGDDVLNSGRDWGRQIAGGAMTIGAGLTGTFVGLAFGGPIGGAVGCVIGGVGVPALILGLRQLSPPPLAEVSEGY